ncbi:squalene synthetase-like protein [Ophidiomyces ophidiicola]|nr:squalene synthetase-like protein [Ophidiomyces ophidiicola]KAI1919690.1 squalene synthetase-like protein [Ophidiomyces ophidiicola]KAI1998844.1 squalene synthetase-like protein [Ophidiomyces ophidiicola]KAI2006998.1 squalene synthetase-like protein [Ophidiomyces ophidiicola]KAI2134067.1 squalene synthetase-like protein [Ophidiomyces ophidiicola]
MSQEALNTDQQALERSIMQSRFHKIQFISKGYMMPDFPQNLEEQNYLTPPAMKVQPTAAHFETTPPSCNRIHILAMEPAPTLHGNHENASPNSDEDRIVFRGRLNAEYEAQVLRSKHDINDFSYVRPELPNNYRAEISPLTNFETAGFCSPSAPRETNRDPPMTQPRLDYLSNKSVQIKEFRECEAAISNIAIADFTADLHQDLQVKTSLHSDTNDAYQDHNNIVTSAVSNHEAGEEASNPIVDTTAIDYSLGDEKLLVSDSESDGHDDNGKASWEHMYSVLSPDSESYEDFDILDFSRASLKNANRKQQRLPTLAMSDSDLERELRTSWQADRRKKVEAKKKREELRFQGLLGRNTSQAHKINHSNVSGLDTIKNEIRSFLLSQDQTLTLPPMEKKMRKQIHRLANHLSLKSQSRGRGRSRFPVLIKTSRTRTFDAKSVNDLNILYNSTSHMRPGSITSRRSSKREKTAPYIEGEVVGASAPKIGAGSKGWMMLEKMGWTNGSSLGALHNKGILQPVSHIVKTSKAGLQ